MPPEVELFLKTTANTLLKLEIIFFYTRNPATVDTVQGLASRLYRDIEQVRSAVHSLTENGVLEQHELGEGAYQLFTFTADSARRALSRKLYDLYHDDPAARVEIIRKIMTWQQSLREKSEPQA